MHEPLIPEVTAIETGHKQGDPPPLYGMAELVEGLTKDAAKRHQAKQTGRPFGPVPIGGQTGKIAREFGGAFPAGLHILLGGSGVGKTAFALQTAATCQCPALYLSLEMSALELLRRQSARVTGEFLDRFRSGQKTADEIRALAIRGARDAPDLWLMDATQAWPDEAHIAATARKIRKESGSDHLLIVVDSLSAWADGMPDAANEYEAVSDAVGIFRSIAAHLDCTVLAIAERNRASFAKNASKDKTGAGAGSRKLEYGSESVLSLERFEGEIPSDPDIEKFIDLTFSKNRNGSPGKEVRLLFNGAEQKYEEVARR